MLHKATYVLRQISTFKRFQPFFQFRNTQNYSGNQLAAILLLIFIQYLFLKYWLNIQILDFSVFFEKVEFFKVNLANKLSV